VRNSSNAKKSSLSVVEGKVSTEAKEQMSMAGVANATTGVFIADGLKTLLTKADNKPATKGDLKLLTERLLGRYHLVKNLPCNIIGEYPYYDLLERNIVYSNDVPNM
jgi:hypothetical protein